MDQKLSSLEKEKSLNVSELLKTWEKSKLADKKWLAAVEAELKDSMYL